MFQISSFAFIFYFFICNCNPFPLSNFLQVKVRIKIVSGSPCGGVVAAEAKRIHSNWVVLDK